MQVFKKYTILVTGSLCFFVTDDKRGGSFVTLMNNRPLFCGTIIDDSIRGHLHFRGLLLDKSHERKASYLFFQKIRGWIS